MRGLWLWLAVPSTFLWTCLLITDPFKESWGKWMVLGFLIPNLICAVGCPLTQKGIISQAFWNRALIRPLELVGKPIEKGMNILAAILAWTIGAVIVGLVLYFAGMGLAAMPTSLVLLFVVFLFFGQEQR